jgi:enamine deaminase RidA (YjgF/YER057c/UK114 family)
MPTTADRRDDTVSARLAAMGMTLPSPPKPIASFAPWTRHGDLIYVSGQIATADGQLVARGRLGDDVELVEGQRAARTCAINVLAQLAVAVSGLDGIARILKLTVFVACTPDFADHPWVADGASNLIVDVFGEAGPHSRSAIGVAALPLGSPVEVEAVALARSAQNEPR